MPVPGRCLEAEMPLRREVPGKRLEENDGEEDGSDNDLHAVKACRHEESRAINVAREFETGMTVFVGLACGEQQAEKDCQREAPDQAFAVACLERMMCPGHGRPGGQKYKRIEKRQLP